MIFLFFFIYWCIITQNIMAQVGLTEYDAKRLFFEYTGQLYHGFSIGSLEDFPEASEVKWVIKVDQLIGKRGKLGLI